MISLFLDQGKVVKKVKNTLSDKKKNHSNKYYKLYH